MTSVSGKVTLLGRDPASARLWLVTTFYTYPEPTPTIAEILIEGFTTDQTGVAMLKRIAEHYPKVTQEDFNAAMAAAQDSLAGRGGDFGHAYSRAEIACIIFLMEKHTAGCCVCRPLAVVGKSIQDWINDGHGGCAIDRVALRQHCGECLDRRPDVRAAD
jgi:hypothetical protein